MANSVDPDQTLRSAVSDIGLHCLQRPICPELGLLRYSYIKGNHLKNVFASVLKRVLLH